MMATRVTMMGSWPCLKLTRLLHARANTLWGYGTVTRIECFSLKLTWTCEAILYA